MDEHPSDQIVEVEPKRKYQRKTSFKPGSGELATREIELPDVGVASVSRDSRIRNENFKQLIRSRVGISDFLMIVDRAVKDAKKGNWRARAWLSDYMIGKPVQYVESQTDEVMRVVVEYVNAPGREES